MIARAEILGRDENELLNRLAVMPGWFLSTPDGLQFGCNWTGIRTAAALLSRSLWWPLDADERERVQPQPIEAARLVRVDRKLYVRQDMVYTLFTVGGYPILRLMAVRAWLYTGQLHVIGEDFARERDRLIGIHLENDEIGRAKLRDIKQLAGKEQQIHVATNRIRDSAQ